MRRRRPDEEPYQWPVFVPRHPPRHPCQNDAQYAAGRRSTERHYESLSVWLGMAQQLATHAGLFRRCERAACRRAKRCDGRYGQDDWSVAFGPILPPCVPREPAIVDRFRAVILEEMQHLIDSGVWTR
ncbi:MAG: hypothetical protein KF914_17575 [Rhizobiaceae bacterium]|nr:hypothetical protein [Rhizobiaceae bacterium]